MDKLTPRVRMFAGPNGSGKSTIKAILNDDLLGVYINPDEIEKELLANGYLDFDIYGISMDKENVIKYITSFDFYKVQKSDLEVKENKVIFESSIINSYLASLCASLIREELLKNKKSFTFETVMSSYDKVEFLKKAQNNGYRTYLYYVATSDVEINFSRVLNRVKLGGHNVPKAKIQSRYYKSLENLYDAIKYSNRAYIFDNSSIKRTWIAEITNAKEVELLSENIPYWFYSYFVKYIT